MKKLMFAAALAAIGTAFAVESGNIVGYQKISLVAGAKAISSGFLEIGTNGVNLTSIVPADYGSKCAGTIKIERLKADGTTDASWNYHAGETSGKFKGLTGWFAGNSKDAPVTAESDVTFVSGEGLWVTGLDGAAITFSGQVPSGNYVFSLVAGAKMIGNPYPTSFKLSTVLPGNYGTKCAGAIKIERLKADGTTDASWNYHAGETSGKFKGLTGWFAGNSKDSPVTVESDVNIAAGEALWVTGIADATLTIPAPTGIATE